MMPQSNGGPQLRRSKLMKESRDVKDHPKINPSANKLFIIALRLLFLPMFLLLGVLTHLMATKGSSSNLNLVSKSFHPAGKDHAESL